MSSKSSAPGGGSCESDESWLSSTVSTGVSKAGKSAEKASKSSNFSRGRISSRKSRELRESSMSGKSLLVLEKGPWEGRLSKCSRFSGCDEELSREGVARGIMAGSAFKLMNSVASTRMECLLNTWRNISFKQRGVLPFSPVLVRTKEADRC
jgi:hypothetical protein